MIDEKEDVKKNEEEMPYLYRSETPNIYVTGAFGGYTAHDFRVIFYNEIPLTQDEITTANEIKIIRDVQAELMMSPLVAKELVIWLAERVKEFEKNFGEIPSPKPMKIIKIENNASE